MTKGLTATITDNETGEIISEEIIKLDKRRVNKMIVDHMLSNAKNISEIDRDLLYAWCKITKNINSYGQIKLLGSFRDHKTEKDMIDDITITGYTMRIIDRAHNFSGMLMSSQRTFITTWTSLWDSIGCTNRKIQRKIKVFLEKNNIVREFKVGGANGRLVKRFILNPFLFRKASYSSQISIMVFQDFIKVGVNTESYPIRWLQSLGYISDDI